MIRVFICMPYGDHHAKVVRQINTQNAMDVWDRLATSGFYPLCPHLSHWLHFRHPHDRMFWLNQVGSWVDMCDCLLAIGGPTEGMREEIARARRGGKPVFYSVAGLASAYGMEIV